MYIRTKMYTHYHYDYMYVYAYVVGFTLILLVQNCLELERKKKRDKKTSQVRDVLLLVS